MPQWLQALIDIALLVAVVLAAGILMRLLLAVLARHTSTARLWHTIAISTFASCSYAFFAGGQSNFSPAMAGGITVAAVFLALIAICSVTWRQALILAPLFLALLAGLHIGVSMTADRLIPNRHTFSAQYRLAEQEIGKAINPDAPLIDVNRIVAQLVDALAKLTTPDEAEQMESDVSVGLAELRARRMAATNQEEVIANRIAFEALRQELLGPPGATGQVSVAQIREALSHLQQQNPTNNAEPVPDLDVALSNLVANLSNTNSAPTFLVLGRTLAEVSRELDAMKTNPVLAAVAAQTQAPIDTNTLAALATELLSNTDTTNSSTLAALTNATASVPTNAVPAPSSITNQVAILHKAQIVYVTPPSELRVSSVVSRDDGSGYAICNGRIVAVGGFASVESDGVPMKFKLESIEGTSPRWSLVPDDDSAEVIPFGGR